VFSPAVICRLAPGRDPSHNTQRGASENTNHPNIFVPLNVALQYPLNVALQYPKDRSDKFPQ